MNSGSEDDRDDDSPVENFKLTISRDSWNGLCELIEADGKFADRFKLKTDYVKIFESLLTEHENMKITLRDRKSRVYSVKRKRTTNYMVGYTICYECLCRYYFTIRDKPADTDEKVEVLVKKVGVHEHTGKRIKAADKIRTHRDKKSKINTLDGEVKIASKSLNVTTVTNGVTQPTPTPATTTTSFVVLDSQIGSSVIINENYESIEIYRNLFKQYESKDSTCNDLFNNLAFVANTQKTCIPSSIIPGFLRNIKIFDEFSITMHSEHQLKSIEYVQSVNRVLHLSFATNLVKLNTSLMKSKLFNHFALLKDFRSVGLRNVKSLLVSEMVCSKFNAYQMSEFYRSINKNFNDIYPKTKLNIRYIVTDFLWESVHSALDAFNNETVIDYSNRVYEFLKNPDRRYENKSWVITCASHTLTKFVTMLKKNFKDSKLRMIACFVFSLMLNSTDLESLTKYFRLICLAFLNRIRTESNYSSLREIQSLISRRSKDETEILKALNSVDIIEKSFLDDKKECVFNQIDEATIRERSPFTELFQNIESEVLREISLEPTTVSVANVYYSTEFVKFLQHYFMPFAFLWVSFSLKDNENQITRMTNGLLDQYISLKKNMVKQDSESLRPAQYAMLAYPQVRHKTEQFVKYQQDELQRKIDDFKYNENESYYVTVYARFYPPIGSPKKMG